MQLNANPELMKMLAGGGGAPAPGGMPPGGGAPGMPPGSPQSAPVSSPMAKPEVKEGDKMGAMVQVQMAIKILEKSLQGLGTQSEEGAAVIDVLGKLSKTFGHHKDKSNELIPAELLSLIGSIMPKGPAGAGAGAGGQPGMPHPAGGMPQPASMPQPPMQSM